MKRVKKNLTTADRIYVKTKANVSNISMVTNAFVPMALLVKDAICYHAILFRAPEINLAQI